MLKEHRFQSHDVAINYAEGPDSGPPLLLVHGIASRWQHYLPVIPGLLPFWHVYALDSRGHGKSGRVPNSYRYLDYAGDVIAFIQRVVKKPAIVFGHSLGAMVTIAVAGQATRNVQAAIVEDPPLYTAGGRGPDPARLKRFELYRDLIRAARPQADMVREFKAALPGENAAALRFRAKSVSQLDPDVMTFAIEGRSRAGYDLDALMRSIKCPVLLLQGNPSLGGVMGDAEAQHALSLIQDCALVRIDDCGHEIHVDRPVETLRAVTHFLQSL
jgi:pimeloyl-ACP methyl ester carboxylesterase